MSWLSRSTDERLVRAVQLQREVQRGPLPRQGSPYAADALPAMSFFAHPASVTVLILVAFVILLIAATAYYAAYSGALRWILSAMALVAGAYVAVRYASASARDPIRLRAGGSVRAGLGGDLSSLRTTAERADSGLVYSQVLFEDRMRKAFLGKVRSNRPFTGAALDAAAKEPTSLQEILGNRDLTLFILEASRNMRAYPSRIPSLPKKEDFAKGAARTLEAMEAWR